VVLDPVDLPADPSIFNRSIQQLLDHAEQLAQRVEGYELLPGDERPVKEYLLERAALARARGERQIVDPARTKGVSRQRIGELLGTSSQSAHQRYGAGIETS